MDILTSSTGREWSRVQAYRESRGDRGLQRLACEVLISALKDYFVWHTPECAELRHAIESADRVNGRVKSREWDRLGVKDRTHSHMFRLASQPDPAEFLGVRTVWHEVAGVDAEQFVALLASPVRLKRLAALLKRTYHPPPTTAAAPAASASAGP
jgi:hypothetical protein